MSKPVIILGGGGHASVLVDILKKQHREILAIVSLEKILERTIFEDITHLKSDDAIFSYQSEDIELVNGIGFLPGNISRERIYNKFTKLGYVFSGVISSSACISSFATLAKDVQVLPGAVINAGAQVKENTIINSRVIVEHDSFISEHCHIAPGSVICGGVEIGKSVFVGCNSAVIQNVVIKNRTVIGAGITVKKSQ